MKFEFYLEWERNQDINPSMKYVIFSQQISVHFYHFLVPGQNATKTSAFAQITNKNQLKLTGECTLD